MSKRCPDCRQLNDNARIFCAYCGSALDAQIRLIQDLERETSTTRNAMPERRRSDMKLYTSHKAPPKKKSSSAPWLLLGLAAAAAVVIWFAFF